MAKNYTGLTLVVLGFPLLLLGMAILPVPAAAQTAVTAPEITFPDLGDVITSAEFDELDWTNATGGSSPYQYRYQIFSDPEYDDLLFQSNWLTTSRATISGLPEGDYFFRVRARDSSSTPVLSPWSNDVDNPFLVTVDNNGDDGDDDDDDDPPPATCNPYGLPGYISFPNNGCVNAINYLHRYNAGYNIGLNQGFNNPFYIGFNAGFYPFSPYPLGYYGNFNPTGMTTGTSGYGGFGGFGGYSGFGGYGGWNQ